MQIQPLNSRLYKKSPAIFSFLMKHVTAWLTVSLSFIIQIYKSTIPVIIQSTQINSSIAYFNTKSKSIKYESSKARHKVGNEVKIKEEFLQSMENLWRPSPLENSYRKSNYDILLTKPL